MRMRLLPTLLLVVAACGSEDGAYLTFASPELAAGSRVDIVLASAHAGAISTVDGQWSAPGDPAEETVVYYRQADRGGRLEAVAQLDGFTVRIAPDVDVSHETAFVPFVIVSKGEAADDALGTITGIGMLVDASGAPLHIKVEPGVIREYQLPIAAVTPISMTSAPEPLAPGQARVVTCAGEQGDWDSGIAWRPSTGPQLRLLLPDIDAEPHGTHARDRALDLDCDRVAADDADCDDLRPTIHAGAAEACGLDANCDGVVAEITACTNSNCGVDAGRASCDAPDVCVAPGCACPAGRCGTCVVGFVSGLGSTTGEACAPALGKYELPCTSQLGCVVTIAEVSGPFEVGLSRTANEPPAQSVTVENGAVYLHVTTTTTADLDARGTAYVTLDGEVFGLAMSFVQQTSCAPSPSDLTKSGLTCVTAAVITP